jgi:hypothetical protein
MMKSLKWIQIIFLLIGGSGSFATTIIAAEETEIFVGVPTVKYDVSVNDYKQTKLTPSQAADNAVRISKVGNDYFWKSRDNRPLVYSQSGDFSLFVEPGGAGYVKITKAPTGEITFLEHVSLGLMTITYYGAAESFEP